MKKIALTAILAGGRGTRMGADKVVVPLGGLPLIERVWSRVTAVSGAVVVVGGEPRLGHRAVETIPDRFPGADSMGGIATALSYAAERLGPQAQVFCTACDMPFLERSLLLYLASLGEGFDAVVPRTHAGYEPFCTLYKVTCLGVLRREMGRGNYRIRDLFGAVKTREVGEAELRRVDPELRSFININRPADLERARCLLEGAA